MREHMRKHPIEKSYDLEKSKEVDKPLSVEEFIRDNFDNLPQWAVMLQGLRHREGLTQESIGKLLGIPQGNISQMEHGKRPIGKQLAKKIANFFDIDYRLFL